MRLFTDAGKQAIGLFQDVISIFFEGRGGAAPPSAASEAAWASRQHRQQRTGTPSGWEAHLTGRSSLAGAASYTPSTVLPPSVTAPVFEVPITAGGTQSFGGVVTGQQGSPVTGYLTQPHVTGAPPAESPLTEEQEEQVLAHVTGKRGRAGTRLI